MLDDFGIPHDFSIGKPQYIYQVIGAMNQPKTIRLRAPVCYCVWCSYGPLPVISTYNPIYRMYNPIYNQL